MDTIKNISITVENLNKNFEQTQALASLFLNLESASLHGIIGPDGAGKTTCLRILAGLLHPTSGKVKYFCGQDQIQFDALRPHIGYMPSKASLYPDLSIEEHLRFFKSLYSLDEKLYRQKTEELFKITRLDKFRDRKAGELSGGMYKKAALMCALLQSPRVLLLDEPTNGVDPISRREFWELLYSLIEQKTLVVVTTAYMDEAERCSKVHFIESGRVILSGEPGKILQEKGVKDFGELFLKEEAK
ncbi:MAG: ABC transporter ATP-binding protein [Elusimicrobia bacterium]|nr:ABC transporter ATP-binding protein [Candidatus Liberimonas magnetica]